jgi:hypothetical protein
VAIALDAIWSRLGRRPAPDAPGASPPGVEPPAPQEVAHAGG